MSSNDDVYHHPVLAFSHGPGPLWLLKHGVENRTSKPARNVSSIFKKLYPGEQHKPKRILLVSAHWETYRIGFEISNSPAPGMLFDYEGFSPDAYKVVYSAKGDPDFANEVATLLSRRKVKLTQVLRAFDHAAFVPLTLLRRQADIPVVTLSINWKLNARAHFELGRALAPLRDQDTLIICSGQATHGLRGEGDNVPQSGLDFQAWLDSVLTKSEEGQEDFTYAQRQEKLLAWESAPGALEAHPRAGHFSSLQEPAWRKRFRRQRSYMAAGGLITTYRTRPTRTARRLQHNNIPIPKLCTLKFSKLEKEWVLRCSCFGNSPSP
ncbi:Catalytic LigB subunit of aromatic ring-opening dioxygenase [Phytophthora infestans]|uniref:Catalytic LigB subunit of aromatic ring-opening dioxygenase n=1 Tax=Phytophthora infestans TaxID=4787 RepID=A0A833T267_PHYIN|nr:Catalytic LigB subunit of aromatic ring-opening dioxygenase [Phytophthora infestans]KAF4137949.1 Catalytic LigB subunit of aromatic ring-opening dioxygenase [Phytophthora infestans]